MLVKYRNYTTKEFIDILNKEQVFFSRHPSAIRGRNQKPDVVLLRVVEDNDKSCFGTILITCEIYNNLEGVTASLQTKGFVKDEVAGGFTKSWSVHYQHSADATKLIRDIMTNLDEAGKDIPLFLYASPQQKALADYCWFTALDVPKVKYRDVAQHLSGIEYGFPGKAEDYTYAEYMVGRYKEQWAAWVSGDLIVPLFASESEAVQFLKERSKRVSWNNPLKITTIPATNKGRVPNIYKLVDPTKSIKEKMAWLQGELARLEGQKQTVCS